MTRKLTLTTACVTVLALGVSAASAGYVVGTLAGQDGWSGGTAGSGFTNNYAQPDTFPATLMPGDEPGRGESVVDTEAHSGDQCWHFKRGYDSSGSGTPYSPPLSVNAGQPSSGAGADTFRAVLWFKAADSAGDGSRISVVGGTPPGTDRSSNYLEIENVAGSGVTVRAAEGVIGSDWDATYTDVATGLDSTSWHKLEMTGLFVDGTYNDTWTYSVDDGSPVATNAYFEVARDNFDFDYEMTGRLKFHPRHANYDASFQGFYFDDILTEVYNASAPSAILDSYATGYEVPEPATLSLLALGGLALLRRRRK